MSSKKFISSSHHTIRVTKWGWESTQVFQSCQECTSPARQEESGAIHRGTGLLANLPDMSIYYSSICEEHYMLLNALTQNISLPFALACALLLFVLLFGMIPN